MVRPTPSRLSPQPFDWNPEINAAAALPMAVAIYKLLQGPLRMLHRVERAVHHHRLQAGSRSALSTLPAVLLPLLPLGNPPMLGAARYLLPRKPCKQALGLYLSANVRCW